MSWIQTFSGRQFFPRNPRPEDFDIGDIAHSLSLQCRFNGHCRVLYSVAEHSVRVSRICPEPDRLWGLLHDLGEAYLVDMPRPIKGAFPLFSQMEERLLHVAAQALGLNWPMPQSVKTADDILLATEARDLMAPPPEPWGHRQEPLLEPIVPWSPSEAERSFLENYETLAGPTRRGLG